jgi:hypothetical protein
MTSFESQILFSRVIATLAENMTERDRAKAAAALREMHADPVAREFLASVADGLDKLSADLATARDAQLVEGGAELPLPVSMGGPELPFADAVDAYVLVHGVTRAECFRRISARTGNSPKGLDLRYRGRGDQVWRFAS